jgi:hypothetical protein
LAGIQFAGVSLPVALPAFILTERNNYEAFSRSYRFREHIAAAEDYIRGMVVEKVMAAPAAPDRDVAKIDAGILTGVPDRTNKVQAPEPLKPSNRFGSPQASIDHFVESRAKTEEFVKTTPGLRDHAADSPVGTKWDAYEFVLLISAHSERHTKQINEVKTDPNYPKN